MKIRLYAAACNRLLFLFYRVNGRHAANCFERTSDTIIIANLLRYNTWVTNKKQEKVLLWYNLIGQTTIPTLDCSLEWKCVTYA